MFSYSFMGKDLKVLVLTCFAHFLRFVLSISLSRLISDVEAGLRPLPRLLKGEPRGKPPGQCLQSSPRLLNEKTLRQWGQAEHHIFSLSSRGGD